MKRIKYSLVLGIGTSFFLTLYLYFKERFNLDVLLVVAVFMLVFMTLVSYFKMFSHINDEEVKFQKLKNIIYSGRANHYKNQIPVGGTLSLVNNQLVFQTNILNFLQKYECIVYIEDIIKIEFDKTLGIVDNGLLLIMKNGLKEKFVVTNRQIWKNEIEKQKEQLIQ